MQVAMYQPDIPQNLGSMVRLCACMGAHLHIIEPCGFLLDDKRLARVAMDYTSLVSITRHISWNAFYDHCRTQNAQLVLLTTKTDTPYFQHKFRADNILLMGRESAGVPEEVAQKAHVRLTIPMQPTARSLNVVTAAAMAMGEWGRQIA